MISKQYYIVLILSRVFFHIFVFVFFMIFLIHEVLESLKYD